MREIRSTRLLEPGKAFPELSSSDAHRDVPNRQRYNICMSIHSFDPQRNSAS